MITFDEAAGTLTHRAAGITLTLPRGWAPAEVTTDYWRGLLVKGPGGGELMPLGELLREHELEPDLPILAAFDGDRVSVVDSWDLRIARMLAPSVAVQLLPLPDALRSLGRIEDEIRSYLEIDAALAPGWRLRRDLKLTFVGEHLAYAAAVEQRLAHILLEEQYLARLERVWIARGDELVAVTVSHYPEVAPVGEGHLQEILAGVRVRMQ